MLLDNISSNITIDQHDRPSMESINFELTKTYIDSKSHIHSKPYIDSLTFTASLQEIQDNIENQPNYQPNAQIFSLQNAGDQRSNLNIFRKRKLSLKKYDNLEKRCSKESDKNLLTPSKIILKLEINPLIESRLVETDRQNSLLKQRAKRSKTLVRQSTKFLQKYQTEKIVLSENKIFKENLLLVHGNATFPIEIDRISHRPNRRLVSCYGAVKKAKNSQEAKPKDLKKRIEQLNKQFENLMTVSVLKKRISHKKCI